MSPGPNYAKHHLIRQGIALVQQRLVHEAAKTCLLPQQAGARAIRTDRLQTLMSGWPAPAPQQQQLAVESLYIISGTTRPMTHSNDK